MFTSTIISFYILKAEKFFELLRLNMGIHIWGNNMNDKIFENIQGVPKIKSQLQKGLDLR